MKTNILRHKFWIPISSSFHYDLDEANLTNEFKRIGKCSKGIKFVLFREFILKFKVFNKNMFYSKLGNPNPIGYLPLCFDLKFEIIMSSHKEKSCLIFSDEGCTKNYLVEADYNILE